eukprot:CAMPEP_0197515742 /NCGR_PEP_ID=MMETSP1318-20131121/778_1 /TAXON_ID=552666 /ORGANISM="Partenskyella glossopodia, Strain RCC365" /LENGTH=544 /DNA_ID=CAMNT_0043064195 /DNA_START=382 /DNA_END=2016 /DNA_ORIENTATION=-
MYGTAMGRLLVLVVLGLLLQVKAEQKQQDHCLCEICGNPGGKKSMVNGQVVETEVGPEEPKPYPPKDDLHVRNDTKLHMLLSAFRDPRCGQTVANAFIRATHPNRIYVGIVQQNLEEKDEFDCVAVYCELMKREGHKKCPWLDHIEIVRVDARESKGPIWARAIGAVMVRPYHDFCMQVDAHVDFMVGYDVGLMKMWAMTENEYGVLSTYVGNIKQDLSKTGHVLIGHPYYEIPFICQTIIGGHGVVRNSQATAAYCLPRPHLSFTWAAGWSFSKCHFERVVPNDPYMEGMFDGEEFGRALRGWTHGYDMYTPHRPVVFHDYTHHRPWQQGRESTWNGNPPGLKYALERYFSMADKLGAKKVDLGAYGLGTERTIDQYVEFSGIDPRTSKNLGLNKCGKLKFVPFEENPGKVRTSMPDYPMKLPGNHSFAHKEDLPAMDMVYVEYAHEMLANEKDQEPSIPHDVQLKEFGSPRKDLWEDMVKKAKAKTVKKTNKPKKSGAMSAVVGDSQAPSYFEISLAVMLVIGVLLVAKEIYSNCMLGFKRD